MVAQAVVVVVFLPSVIVDHSAACDLLCVGISGRRKHQVFSSVKVFHCAPDRAVQTFHVASCSPHPIYVMKFGALLRNSAAELPELHQLFVSYKQLKKRLKRLPERQELVRQRVRVAGGELPEVDVREVRQQEEAFVQVLDQDVQQFNRYWL